MNLFRTWDEIYEEAYVSRIEQKGTIQEEKTWLFPLI